MYVNAGETYGWESEDFWCDERPVVSKDFFFNSMSTARMSTQVKPMGGILKTAGMTKAL